MELFDAIRQRRTIRKYTGAPIPCEQLEQIVNAGRLAASGMNTQPWEFIVITDAAQMAKLRVPEDHWSTNAAALIAVVMDPTSRWWMEDASAAVQNMLLACTALGYGACWAEGYTRRNAAAFKAALHIPENRELFTLVVIGVPDEQPSKDKKSLEEVIHWQQYGQKS